jgi:uncharacterized membrane protein YccC
MKNKKQLLMQFSIGILLALTGAILMFFGIGPITLRIIFGIVGITLIANSPIGIKIRKT